MTAITATTEITAITTTAAITAITATTAITPMTVLMEILRFPVEFGSPKVLPLSFNVSKECL